jgi:hypothetical protein
MVEGVIPTCLALVLCKAVVRRARTAEPVIFHAFEFFEAASLPSPAMPFTVWMQLRDGNGPTAMQLVVEYLPPGILEPEEVVTVRFNLIFSDPNLVLEHEAVFENGLPLEQVGRYRPRLAADRTTIIQRYFGVFRSTK